MHKHPGFRFYFLLVVAMVTWGFAWPSGKTIAGLADPYVIIFWRFLLTAASLLAVNGFLGIPLRLPSLRIGLHVAIGGVLYTAYNVFFLLGLELGMAGKGGVLVTTLNPILTYGIVHLMEKKTLTSQEIFGLVLGMIGGGILLQVWELDWEVFFHSGNFFFLLGSLSWAFLSIHSQRTGEKISPILYSFYVFSWGTALDLLFAIQRDLGSVFQLGVDFWFQIFYLAVVSTTFGTTVYFFASTRLGSRVASSFIFLVPLSALLGSWLFLGEIPHWTTLLGGILAMLAVVLISRGGIQKEVQS